MTFPPTVIALAAYFACNCNRKVGKKAAGMGGSAGLEERGNWSSQGPQKKRRKGGEADLTPAVSGFEG